MHKCMGSIERGLSEAQEQAQHIWDLMVWNKEDELKQALFEPAAPAARWQQARPNPRARKKVEDGFEHAAEAKCAKCMDDGSGKCEMIVLRFIL